MAGSSPRALTKRESDCYQAIRQFIRRRGYPPTNHELAGLLGLTDYGKKHGKVGSYWVAQLLDSLQQKRLIRINPGAPRGIEVLPFSLPVIDMNDLGVGTDPFASEGLLHPEAPLWEQRWTLADPPEEDSNDE